MRAYYNEIDPFCAQWLRNLIARNLIAPGDVDERDIRLVQSDDLRGYRQCHFFAGIGVWSYALRLAGWPDDESVWTGSCPCQPFSAAGAGGGAGDARHLWPAWFPLIRDCRPDAVFGEQVASRLGRSWLVAVRADLENLGYAVGRLDTCAAGVGAPHIRQRLYFVADGSGYGRREKCQEHRGQLAGDRTQGKSTRLESGGCACELADAASNGRQAWRGSAGNTPSAEQEEWNDALRCRDSFIMGDPKCERLERFARHGNGRNESGRLAAFAAGSITTASATRGFWNEADWLICRDGKARAVESGTFPLAHGTPARMGRLRAYGNAIVAQVAAEFIRGYLDVRTVA